MRRIILSDLVQDESEINGPGVTTDKFSKPGASLQYLPKVNQASVDLFQLFQSLVETLFEGQPDQRDGLHRIGRGNNKPRPNVCLVKSLAVF